MRPYSVAALRTHVPHVVELAAATIPGSLYVVHVDDEWRRDDGARRTRIDTMQLEDEASLEQLVSSLDEALAARALSADAPPGWRVVEIAAGRAYARAGLARMPTLEGLATVVRLELQMDAAPFEPALELDAARRLRRAVLLDDPIAIRRELGFDLEWEGELAEMTQSASYRAGAEIEGKLAPRLAAGGWQSDGRSPVTFTREASTPTETQRWSVRFASPLVIEQRIVRSKEN